MAKKSYLLIAMLFASPFSFGASFDCAKAATPVEKLICSDDALSTLDEQLGAAYRQALSESTDKELIKKAQAEWLKEQRACKDSACLTEKYRARIAVLKTPSSIDRAAPSSVTAKTEENKKLIVTTGYEKPLCNQYLALMQRVPRNPENSCGLEYSFDEKAKAQGFSEIPWEEVDPKKYENMLFKYWMYLNRDWTSDEGKKKKRDEFYNVIFNNKLFLWHAVFDLNNDGKPDEVFKFISGDCKPGKGMFFIPSEKGFSSNDMISTHENIFFYKGETYRGNIWGVYGISGGDIYVNPGLTVCEFKK